MSNSIDPLSHSTATTRTDDPQATYIGAITRFAHDAAAHGIRPEALDALIHLNSVYYLSGVLPSAAYADALAEAAAGVRSNPMASQSETGGERVASRSQPGEPRISLASKRKGAGGQITPVDLLRLLDGRAGDLELFVQVQHLLEIAALLQGDERSGLLAAGADFIASHPVELGDPACPAADAQLRDWAVRNERPPREGEFEAWATVLPRRTAHSLLPQALASGLRFSALIDALVLASARAVPALPRGDAVQLLAAAHAVRRLSELAGAPALAGWAAVASKLRRASVARVTAQKTPARRGPSPLLAELALAALARGEGRMLQVCEVVVAELDVLPRQFHAELPAALAAIVGERNEQSRGVER